MEANPENYNPIQNMVIPKDPIDLNKLLPMDSKDSKIIVFYMPEEEFSYLWDSGVLFEINKRLDYMIDEFESERIPVKDCFRVLDILDEFDIPTDFMVPKAVLQAVKQGTFIELNF